MVGAVLPQGLEQARRPVCGEPDYRGDVGVSLADPFAEPGGSGQSLVLARAGERETSARLRGDSLRQRSLSRVTMRSVTHSTKP